MAKADLGELLKKRATSDSVPATASAEPTSAPIAPEKVATERPPKTAPEASKNPHNSAPQASSTVRQTAETESTGEPLYLRLERKEARLREDQLEGLSAGAKRLQRAKGTGGERITDNTLIRVAVDLLLARLDEAHGQTESEILRSLRP